MNRCAKSKRASAPATRIWLATATLAACLGASDLALARPYRVAQLPNGAVAGCLTCHVYPGGPRNAFGQTVESYGGVGFLVGGDVQWGTVAIADPAHPGEPPKYLAELDSDQDGRTNGQELLDGAGSWRVGESDPGDPALVRLPGLRDAPIVIRQIYTGGGSVGALYQADFIELFNRSTTTVSLAGWSLQLAPPTGPGNFGSEPARISELPSVALRAGQSYLVQGATLGSAGVALTADLIDPSPLSLETAGGKLALVSNSTPLGCNGYPTDCSNAALAPVIDLVGYGNATFYEGSVAPAPANDTALLRTRGGCTDINSNGSVFAPVPADFALSAPAPRSRTSALAPCDPSAPLAVPAVGTHHLVSLFLLCAAAWRRHPRGRS